MSFINDSIILLINILHLMVILFIVGAPFSNSNYLLLLHVIVVPFILLHWLLNNNTCCLTVAEKYIRCKTYGTEIKENDCFTYKFIAPIYDFNKNYDSYSNFIYITTFGLWSISTYNIFNKIYHKQIKNLHDVVSI